MTIGIEMLLFGVYYKYVYKMYKHYNYVYNYNELP